MAGKRKRAATPAAMTKTDFIRSLDGLPAKEIVARAKAAGLDLTAQYVYEVRSTKRASPRNATPGSESAPSSAPPVATTTEHERQLAAMVLEIGVRGTRELLARVCDKITRAASE